MNYVKNIFILILMGGILFSSCKPKPSENLEETNLAQAVQLTETQKEEGWKILFNGTSLENWRTFKGKENNTWEVLEGTLHCKPFIEGQTEKRADLMTVEQFEDFELAFEWKISAQGNSGVIFRVSEEYDQPYATGPEYQIVDDEGYPGDVKEVHFSGANYDMQGVSEKVVKPVGEWNQAMLVVKGNHVEHWLNGKQVVTYELHSPEWEGLRNNSKWKDFPGYGTVQKGHLDFQDHGNEVWFRNVLIKPL